MLKMTQSGCCKRNAPCNLPIAPPPICAPRKRTCTDESKAGLDRCSHQIRNRGCELKMIDSKASVLDSEMAVWDSNMPKNRFEFEDVRSLCTLKIGYRAKSLSNLLQASDRVKKVGGCKDAV